MDKNTEACLLKKDKKEALNCLKETVPNDTSNCKPKIVLLVQKDCDVCGLAKKEFHKDIANNKIQLIDVDSPEGTQILKQNKDIEGVPELYLIDCKGKIIPT